MASPPFPESRALEEFVDEFPVALLPLRRIEREKGVDGLRRRREADQVEVKTPQQGGGIGVGDRFEIGVPKRGENETVDPGAGPVVARSFRNSGIAERLQGPEALGEAFEIRFVVARGRPLFGVRQALFDPLLELGDVALGEHAVRRHLEIGITVADHLDEQALPWLARHRGGAGIASRENGGPGIEHQPPLRLLRFVAVALVAVRLEERFDVGVKIVDPGIGLRDLLLGSDIPVGLCSDHGQDRSQGEHHADEAAASRTGAASRVGVSELVPHVSRYQKRLRILAAIETGVLAGALGTRRR